MTKLVHSATGTYISLSAQRRAEKIYRDFKEAWKAAPKLEDFLPDRDKPERIAIFEELLRLDIEYRRLRGEKTSLDNYQVRFPEHRELVRRVMQATPPPTPAQPTGDRNLLLGVTALQTGMIEQEALIKAMSAWTLNKTKSLAEILQENGELSRANREKLEELLPRDTTQHRFLKKAGEAPLEAGLSRLEGGFGKITKARDREFQDREVALKELHEKFAHVSQHRDRFLREAEVTAKLQHPGIVPVYGMGHFGDGRPYYAMRFIEGENLKAAVHRYHQDDPDRKPEERRLQLVKLLGRFVTVCNTVAYAHSRGFIHRDLKPANILLGKFGETLVADWGLAKPVDLGSPSRNPEESGTPWQDHAIETEDGARLGTPPYMSPEQAAGHPDIGPASDIYSLGATLYEILTGSAPVKGKSVNQILERVSQGNWLPPRQLKPDIPAPLDAICRTAMALEPKDRYAAALDLAAEIERWLVGERVQVYRERFKDQARRWMELHRSGVTISVAGMLFIALREAEEQRDKSALHPPPGEAHSTLDDTRCPYYPRLSEGKQWQDHVLQPQRKKMLELGMEVFQMFMQEERDELIDQEKKGRPAKQLANMYHAECGRAYFRLANLYSIIARDSVGDRKQANYHKAQRAYQDALTIFRHLTDDCPQLPEYGKEQAAILCNLGILYGELGQTDQAEEAFQDALKIQKGLAEAHTDISVFLQDLAGTYNNQSILFSRIGWHDKALTAFDEVVALHKKLADANPASVSAALALGNSYFHVGRLEKLHGTLQRARECYESAVSILEQILQHDPQNAAARQSLVLAQRGRDALSPPVIMHGPTGTGTNSGTRRKGKKRPRSALGVH